MVPTNLRTHYSEPPSDSLAFIVHPLTVRFCTHVYAKVLSSIYLLSFVKRVHADFVVLCWCSQCFFLFLYWRSSIWKTSCAKGGNLTDFGSNEAGWVRNQFNFEPKVELKLKFTCFQLVSGVSFPPWLYEDRVSEFKVFVLMKCGSGDVKYYLFGSRAPALWRDVGGLCVVRLRGGNDDWLRRPHCSCDHMPKCILMVCVVKRGQRWFL